MRKGERAEGICVLCRHLLETRHRLHHPISRRDRVHSRLLDRRGHSKSWCTGFCSCALWYTLTVSYFTHQSTLTLFTKMRGLKENCLVPNSMHCVLGDITHKSLPQVNRHLKPSVRDSLSPPILVDGKAPNSQHNLERVPSAPTIRSTYLSYLGPGT